MKDRYNKYSTYIQNKFGTRVQKVTLDGGFSCPNRDGSKGRGGCIFCNNASFSPALNRDFSSITEQLDTQIKKLDKRYRNVEKYIAYFQPFSNTHAPLTHLKERYEEALAHPKVIGLSIATRPDCIDKDKLAYLQTLSKDYEITIEYGLESISDETLKRINRGHDFACFVEALQLTKGYNLKTTTHIMLGFPWEDKAHWLNTAEVLSTLPIDFLKIHQLCIVKDTPLAKEYQKSPFPLLEGEEYMQILVEFIERLSPNIIIQKLLSELPRKYLVSDHWVKNLSRATKALEHKLEKLDTYQGKLHCK